VRFVTPPGSGGEMREDASDAKGARSGEDERPAAGAYRPRPVDTSGVEIPPDVAALTELLARNTHENWASQRLSDGWRWGPVRDDTRREHPGLVAYEELSEAERDYDRQDRARDGPADPRARFPDRHSSGGGAVGERRRT
jgi:hypothetical protein